MQPDAAANLVLATGSEIVATINAVDLPAAQRRGTLGVILRRSVDIPGVGQFVLGRQWGLSAAAEQQEFLRLFEELIIHTLSMRFSSYAGLRFSLGRSQQLSEDEVLINTAVEYDGSMRFTLDWRVSEVAGVPRVVDVIAEGTSMRLALRSEYAAVLSRNGNRMSALLDAMRRQVATLAARG
nr:ABC transporter substrate-binding protein [Plastoroseomonas hellenica]